MKREIALLAVIAVATAGCSKENLSTPASTAVSKAEAKAAKPDEAVFDEAGLAQAKLEVVGVAYRSLPMTVRASGRLTTNEVTTWRVGSITDGRIVTAEVNVGDRVQKGQLLARIFSHDIHEARAEYSRALAEFTRMKAQLDFAQRQRDRARRLYELKATSLEQVEHAETELKSAQGTVASSEIEVARTKSHLVDYLEIPATPPNGGAAKDADLIPVRAPASGIVLERLVTPGEVVGSNSGLYVISDLSTVWAIAAVQEEHLSRLRTGMTAKITVQAYPDRPFTGRVLKIDEKLDAEMRTVNVRVEIPNRGGLLKPEMYATIELDAGGSAEALFVPQVAVQDVSGKPTVFVETGPGRFAPRAVTTGRPMDSLVEITSGLTGGEKVVARGAFIVKSQLLKSSLEEE